MITIEMPRDETKVTEYYGDYFADECRDQQQIDGSHSIGTWSKLSMGYRLPSEVTDTFRDRMHTQFDRPERSDAVYITLDRINVALNVLRANGLHNIEHRITAFEGQRNTGLAVTHHKYEITAAHDTEVQFLVRQAYEKIKAKLLLHNHVPFKGTKMQQRVFRVLARDVFYLRALADDDEDLQEILQFTKPLEQVA